MYDKAFRDFDANNYPEALQQLDAIDARQPDLAESQNLRGVIFMRQGIYDKAEAALYRRSRASIRNFGTRASTSLKSHFCRRTGAKRATVFRRCSRVMSAELQGEATQLIQYKILLTYILEGKENMVDSFLPSSNFRTIRRRCITLMPPSRCSTRMTRRPRNGSRRRRRISLRNSTSFSPSRYTKSAGWKNRPARARAALELTSAAERAAQDKSFRQIAIGSGAASVSKRDFDNGAQVCRRSRRGRSESAADSQFARRDPDGAKGFRSGGSELQEGAQGRSEISRSAIQSRADSVQEKGIRQGARSFEALFASTPGGDKNQAAQIIKFKIFMTLLLEGKDSRAQKMMEQFQFTGDTPALYYAQAAWEFKHNNPTKANDWITSARKIYSLALNFAFADSFYDAGWLQNPAVPEEIASSKAIAQTESPAPSATNPGIEPSPIPGSVPKENQVAKEEAAPSIAPSSTPEIAGMQATTSSAEISPAPSVAQASATIAPEATSAPVPTPPILANVGTTATPVEQKPVVAATATAAPVTKPVSSPPPVVATTAKATSTPATVLAPSQVREFSPTTGEHMSTLRTLLVISLLVAAIAILASVIVPVLRRRLTELFRRPVPAAPVSGPSFEGDDLPTLTVNEEMNPRHRFTGGPPKRSVQLKATEPSVRRAVLPTGKGARPATAIREAEFAGYRRGDHRASGETRIVRAAAV